MYRVGELEEEQMGPSLCVSWTFVTSQEGTALDLKHPANYWVILISPPEPDPP